MISAKDRCNTEKGLLAPPVSLKDVGPFLVCHLCLDQRLGFSQWLGAVSGHFCYLWPILSQIVAFCYLWPNHSPLFLNLPSAFHFEFWKEREWYFKFCFAGHEMTIKNITSPLSLFSFYPKFHNKYIGFPTSCSSVPHYIFLLC